MWWPFFEEREKRKKEKRREKKYLSVFPRSSRS